MRRLLLLALLYPLVGCQGTAPPKDLSPSLGAGAVLIRGRLVGPAGETTNGSLIVNLEGNEGEAYRLSIVPKQTSLFTVEPGVYHIYPTRTLWGNLQSSLDVTINGKKYAVPFPRSLLRMDAIRVKPKRIVPLGVLEAKLVGVGGDAGGEVVVSLDDSLGVRRQIVQEFIADMMDPKAPASTREDAITWTQALDQALVEIQGSHETKPAFKRSE